MGDDLLMEPCTWPADPAEQFAALAEERYSFFLDSGMVSEKLGRYSFLGCEPFLVLRSKGTTCEVEREGHIERSTGDPFDLLRELLQQFSCPPRPGLPPLPGGAVGYLAYDLRHFMETLPATARDDVPLPDLVLGFYDVVLILDHLTQQAWLASTGFPAQGAARLRRARQRLREWQHRFATLTACPPHLPPPSPPSSPPTLSSNFTRQAYEEAIRRAQEYIAAGDIYQVNLSQRLCADLTVPPWTLYRRLRTLNPAPFAAYLNLGEAVVASASPERFLRYQALTRRMQTRPIKGTRPRGATPEADAALAQELLQSEKDHAEHLMIVDLERNDLGRVAEVGSVHVSEYAILECFPTVFHLTSTVEGVLAPPYDRIDLLRATFPGGSITGAPKIRSMEIIDELEPTQRGIYTGSIGYFGCTGDMDLSIVIRTFVLYKGRAYFQVGGGVVADSSPAGEYQETLDKAQALWQALSGQEDLPQR
jgi:para-aminobenzoate synthetase component 1